MNPRLDRVYQEDEKMNISFTNTNYSIVNALRRTILSDIPVVSFTTFPHDENKCEIFKNTSNLNNEIVKHRLSCVPVYLDPNDETYKSLKIVVNVKNDTNETIYVTTEDFEVYDINTQKPIKADDIRKIFPSDKITEDFIDFVRLKSEISGDIPGEELHFEATLDINTAKSNGCYNCVSLCSYINTPDTIKANDMWIEKEKTLKQKKESKEDIEYIKNNWFLLDAKRICIENSYEFSIQTIGVLTNETIFKMSCDILIEQLKELGDKFESDSIIINKPVSTTENEYEVILEGIDHTIGKVLEYILYEIYYMERQLITLCGFRIKHPHDNFSVIRIALAEAMDKEIIREYCSTAIQEAKKIFMDFGSKF
tara:strand:+ start:735 stop:1838 length:1104 start_codon:yes stop_codon:yes gene_type:complete